MPGSCSDGNGRATTRSWTTSWPPTWSTTPPAPQGRDGLKTILHTIEVDLGPAELEQHHLIGEADLVVQHVTLHGTHRASTMPLLADAPITGRSAAWRFIHIWRVADGMLVEHWACRDDMGLLEQLRPS